jgi:NAD-specific glutamate dehydrogenase
MEYVSGRDRMLHKQILKDLVDKELLNLEVEGFPPMGELKQRLESGQGLTRPELIVLFAYVKMDLKKMLLSDEHSKIFCTSDIISEAFPKDVVKLYGNYLTEHPLAHEIAITHLINRLTSIVGISFFYRLLQETQENLVALFQAALRAIDLFEISSLLNDLYAEQNMSFSERYAGVFQIYRLLFRATKWIALNHTAYPALYLCPGLKQRIALYQYEEGHTTVLERSLHAPKLFPSLGLILISPDSKSDRDFFETFKKIQVFLNVSQFSSKIEDLPAHSAAEAQTRSWLREDFLQILQKISYNLNTELAWENFSQNSLVIKWNQNFQTLMNDNSVDFSQLFVLIKFLEKISRISFV